MNSIVLVRSSLANSYGVKVQRNVTLLHRNKTTIRQPQDDEGQTAMRELKRFLGNGGDPDALVFRTKHGTPVQETTVLKQCLHPAAEALGLPKAGMRALRRGCNRRWELAGINPAVLRQQMGHSSSAMTELYTGEIPIEQVRAAYSKAKTGLLENMENGAAA